MSIDYEAMIELARKIVEIEHSIQVDVINGDAILGSEEVQEAISKTSLGGVLLARALLDLEKEKQTANAG